MSFEARKLYYRIGEVCRVVGVEPHVLRFWETQFPSLVPPKNRKGQRTYRPKDIELILEIRRLLYEDGYTIAGARKQLILEGRAARAEAAAGSEAAAEKATAAKPKAPPASQRIDKVRKELENILTLLDRE